MDQLWHSLVSTEIDSLAGDFQHRDLFNDNLKKLTQILREKNELVLQVLSQNAEKISESTELDELSTDYYDNYGEILEFCRALQGLQTTHENQSQLLVTLQNIGASVIHVMLLDELMKFKAEHISLLEDILSKFTSLYERECEMKKTLQHYNEIISKKCKSLRRWRINGTAIWVSACVCIVVATVIATAVVVPPLAAALTIASTIPIGSVGKAITDFYKQCEIRLKGHKKISSEMEDKIGQVIKSLETIGQLIRSRKEFEERPPDKGELAVMESVISQIKVEVKKEQSLLKRIVDYCKVGRRTLFSITQSCIR